LVPALPVKTVALALVAAATLLHLRDVRRGGVMQALLTGLVIALIVGFIVVALASGRADWMRIARPQAAAVGSEPGIGAVGVSLVYVAYSYFGWNAAAYVAGEIRDPDRTLPRALLGGTALVTVLYVALNAVFLSSAPAAELAGKVEIAHVAATALLGSKGGVVVSALVALALAGSVSALTMTGPRVVQAMAQDGQFFRALGRTGAGGAPTAAVLLQGALAAAGILTAAFEPLLVYAGFTLTLSAAATVAGAFVLRRREPAAARPHRALAWPVSGIAYLSLAAFMTVFAIRERPTESLAGIATLLAGTLAWLVWQRRRRR
jgi:APA family basic amino acid/polyamine antiporter